MKTQKWSPGKKVTPNDAFEKFLSGQYPNCSHGIILGPPKNPKLRKTCVRVRLFNSDGKIGDATLNVSYLRKFPSKTLSPSQIIRTFELIEEARNTLSNLSKFLKEWTE